MLAMEILHNDECGHAVWVGGGWRRDNPEYRASQDHAGEDEFQGGMKLAFMV